MSAPAKMPTERQVHQAIGLTVLSSMVIHDERISEILADELALMRRHLGGEHRQDDLRHFAQAARQAGAEVTEEHQLAGTNGSFDVVTARWSEHFSVGLQCDSTPAECWRVHADCALRLAEEKLEAAETSYVNRAALDQIRFVIADHGEAPCTAGDDCAGVATARRVLGDDWPAPPADETEPSGTDAVQAAAAEIGGLP